ncbi:hypothetical protein DACRYDRAFT_108690 [Dacryopinax primogenitus]|uniref:Uncharacterized protein n=1 Tax=Dacryopinax primogenitus (strain DJM 731) TaxID=1858805 RepID=M5FSX6_DACPD|nr:uncharacterized protein DACRYDRAFT_108690 [Dacryopinax primogenitus]EJU00626.1 hypothetical protein DACRYDRAFT_108690 [Dacryopinax primogenitus]
MRTFTLSFLLFAVLAIAAPLAEPQPVAEAEVDARGPPNANAWCGNRACAAYA